MNNQTDTLSNASNPCNEASHDNYRLLSPPINEHYLIATGTNSIAKRELAEANRLPLNIAKILSQDEDKEVSQSISDNKCYPIFFRRRPPTSVSELLVIMKEEVVNHICSSGLDIECHSELHESIQNDPSSQIAVIELNEKVTITSGETTPFFLDKDSRKVVYEVWLLPINEGESMHLKLDTYSLCEAIREAIILAVIPEKVTC